MKLFDNLKLAVNTLAPWPGCWAICGGIAACLYRETPRFTGDIDIALADTPEKSAFSIAQQVTEALGYKPIQGYVSDQHGQLIPGTALVLGRESSAGNYIGIDFLLPVVPWVTDGVRRAQSNLIDYGFASLATLTPEDLIVAKLFALQGTPERRQDLDDIESIVRGSKMLDPLLLLRLTREFALTLPPSVSRLLELRSER